MMWWNGGWGWMWLFMVPMWALVAWVIVHFARTGRVGPAETVGPLGTLDGRLAAADHGGGARWRSTGAQSRARTPLTRTPDLAE